MRVRDLVRVADFSEFFWRPFRLMVLSLALLGGTPVYAQVSFNAGGPNGGAIVVGKSTDVCVSSLEGALRYSSANGGVIELCNGSSWIRTAQVQGTTGPTAPAGSGYFVLTQTTWNGNLGGLAGADTKCLTELATTYTTWRGYATASANGQLVAAKVKAFLCNQTSCNNLMPLTTYYFAYANSAVPGGASFTTNSSGYGPNDNASWAAANYFSGSYSYWSNRKATSGILWGEQDGSNSYDSCGSWWNSSGNDGVIGASGNTNGNRFSSMATPCNVVSRLICYVNP